MPESDDIKTAEECRQAVRLAVEAAIGNMTTKLTSGDFKITIGDFAKLLELQKELVAGSIRHVKVTWVDSLNQTEPAD